MQNQPPLSPGDSFVQTSLDRRSISLRRLLSFVVLGLAMVGVIAGAVLLWPLLPRPAKPVVVVHLTPTATYLPTYTLAPVPPTATATPDITLVYPQPGWTIAGPVNAIDVGFAASDPSVAYACGPTALPTAAGLITGTQPFSFAQHNAQGWGPWTPLGINSIACSVQVNPTNARDVALLINTCTACIPQSPSDLYRSQDGGAHWVKQLVPVDPNDPQGLLSFLDIFWAGNTLFADRYHEIGTDPQMTHFILASRNGQPFGWVDDALGLSAKQSIFGSIEATNGTTCYLQVVSTPTAGGNPVYQRYQSTDGGIHWTLPRPFSVGTNAVQLLRGSPTGQALIGTVTFSVQGAPNLYRSFDQGQTWQAFPAPVPNSFIANNYLLAPDGTVFYVDWISPRHQFYRWDRGAPSAQSFGASFPGQMTLLAIAADIQGHALAIWAGHPSNTPDEYIGLQQVSV